MNYTTEQKKNIDIVINYIKPGDVITYSLGGGKIAESVFIKIDEKNRLESYPTDLTMKLIDPFGILDLEDLPESRKFIYPVHVTHINRQEITAIPFNINQKEETDESIDSEPGKNFVKNHPNSKDILDRGLVTFRGNRQLWAEFGYWCAMNHTSRSDVLENFLLETLGKSADDYR